MEQKFKYEITAHHRLLDLHFDEILQYRDLIFIFVKRDFKVQFKQTMLGPLWSIIQPLITTVVFTIIFGNLANLTTSDVPGAYLLPGFLFYMAGNICWNYFSMAMTTISRTFLDNRDSMGKVYYPRLASPIATIFSKLVSFGIQLCLFLLCWGYFIAKGGTSIRVTWNLLLIPVVVLQLMLLSLGIGILVSAFTTRYRDLLLIMGFIMDVWRYFCPIAYGLTLVPGKYMGLYMLNPVTLAVTTFRYAAFGFGYFSVAWYMLSWLETIIILVIGLILFNKTEKNFMDVI